MATNPTPPSGAPSSDQIPSSGAPSSAPAPKPDIPNNAPMPPSAEPNVDLAQQYEVPDTAPTPSSVEPNVDPTPQPEVSNTAPTPPLLAPNVDPTPPPDAPNSDPNVPKTTSTAPPAGPPSTPTPPSGTVDTTPTSPAKASSSDPTPAAKPEVADTTPTSTPAGAANTSPAPSAVPHETSPTTPTEAPSSGATRSPARRKTTQKPTSVAPSSDLPDVTSNATPTTAAGAAVTTPTPEPQVEWALQKLKEKVMSWTDPETTPFTFTLHGETGAGKTWMAREIYKSIHKAGDKSPYASTLWLSLKRAYQPSIDRTSTTRWSHANILEDIARQLCVLPATEGGFEDDDQDGAKANNEDQKGPQADVPDLGHAVEEKLRSVTHSWKKLVLLALDGVPESMDFKAETVIDQVEPLRTLRDKLLLRVIVMITTERSTTTSTGGTKSDVGKDHEEGKLLLKALKEDEFLKLLETSEAAEGSKRSSYVTKQFKDVIFGNSSDVSLPAAVAVVVGKALKHNFGEGGGGHDDQVWHSWEEGFENFLKEATRHKEVEKMESSLIRYAFDTLPSGDAAMIKCCWHSRKFFELIHNAAVHYNELISHWIMEGYLDEFRDSGGVKEAYEKGYHIFEELLKRGLLKVEDGDFIAMEGLALKVQDHRREGFDETAKLGLPDVFRGDKDWQGLGKIAVADGMIKSVCGHKKWRLVSTLVIDGSRLCREVPGTFFKPMEELRVLVLLNTTLKSLDFIGGGGDHGDGPSPLSKLRLLVLRGCDVLENVDSIKKLESLIVLEISGANSLKKLPDDLFEKMSLLRSLNLSETQVESLPSSFSNLTKLRWLILRNCSKLKEMPSLKAFVDLQVLDMFGSCSLTKFRDKKFGDLVKLRVLDFSRAKIAPLPFVHTLSSLTRLNLKDCSEITRLPHLEKLQKLQFLELSGAKRLVEFYSPHFENKEALRVLDLSETGLSRLPKPVSNLLSLVELNLSHMSSLEGFEGVSFDKLACLQCLNLSNTNVKSLPSLSGLKSLRQLFLSDCPHLEALPPEMEVLTTLEILDLSRADELKEIPDKEWKFPKLSQLLLPSCKKLEKLPILNSLHKLEVLNLSGCEALEELGKQSFQEMSALQVLDLSATKVQSLPNLTSSSNLRRLLLENCRELQEIPPLDSLSKLEELSLCGVESLQKRESKAFHFKVKCGLLQTLNLSGIKIDLSLDFAECTNLKKVSLGGCLFSNTKPQLKKLTMLENLDLSYTSIKPQNSSKNHNPRKVSLEELADDLKTLLKLTNLDLRGLEVKKFPDWISNLVHLKSLFLPNLEGIQSLDWGKIKHLPDELNWEECGIFDKDSIHNASARPSISMSSTKVLKLLKDQSEIWKKCFCEFRIYVCPSQESGKNEDIYRLRNESFFEEIYFKTICCPESCKRFLEIRGFENSPEDLSKVLEGVDCMSFIDDRFIKSLSDLGDGNMEAVTGLWLDRCTNTEFIFSEGEAPKFGDGFRLLWASNLPQLKSLYKENVQVQSFKKLTQLYLDCCPMLEYVFSSSQLPENLEKLQVKFCDKLKTLLKDESSENPTSLQKLSELHLLELPELTTVGVKLPCLQNAEVKGCPKLEKKAFLDGLGLQNKIVEVTNVEENWERGASKETKEYPFLKPVTK